VHLTFFVYIKYLIFDFLLFSRDTDPLFKSLDEPVPCLPRLSRCAAISTGEDGALPRSKPFKYTYEKEIVMYAYFKKLDYFSTECE
jgi:hypothetical protein